VICIFAQCFQICRGTQRTADQALDFLGAARLLAARGFALHAGTGGARQHAVFGGDPAFALAPDPRRHAFFQRRSAQHVGVAEFDQARSFGMFGKSGFQAHGAHHIKIAATGSHIKILNP